MFNLKFIFRNKQAKLLFYLLLVNVLITGYLLVVCRSSSSLVLNAFAYLTIFDILSIITALLAIWVKYQAPKPAYPYGLKRCEVLAIFSCAVLTILGSFFIMKEAVESLFETKEVHTGRLVPSVLVGFIMHIIVTISVRNEGLNYVVKSSPSSWLQEQIFDISESLCRYIPGLSNILLPRVNPFILLGIINTIVVIGTYLLIQIGYSQYVDTYGSMLMAIMTIGTMLPLALFTSKILLQTTPSHMITQLDKSLREASTLDGVLEFRDEHFWTLSFGVLVGSLHVRVRRDADEQLVLAHVWNKLAGLVHILTIHIFKDDWMRRTTHQLVYNSNQTTPQPIQLLPQYSKTSSASPTSQILNLNNLSYQQFPIANLTKSMSPLSTGTTTTRQNVQTPVNNPTSSQSSSIVVDNDYVIVNP